MKKDLCYFRKQLDKVDAELIQKLSERFKITRQVGKFKKENNLPPLDKEREKLIYEKIKKEAIKFDLDPDFLKDIWWVIMTQSKKEYKEI
jgi:monofunctional chorismate mutase